MLSERITPTFKAVIICCLTFVPASGGAQNSGMVIDPPPRTSAQALRSFGIELSTQSLTIALSNANPKIRGLAAEELAEKNGLDAGPSIERAFSNEKDPITRVELAAALDSAHDSNGVEYLKEMCADTTLPIRATIDAVEALQVRNISSEACASGMVSSLDRTSDIDYRDTVIGILPTIYSEATDDQKKQIISAVQNMLLDETQQPVVRLAAGNALAQIGSITSAKAVREAMARENDSVIRLSLQNDLNIIEKKP